MRKMITLPLFYSRYCASISDIIALCGLHLTNCLFKVKICFEEGDVRKLMKVNWVLTFKMFFKFLEQLGVHALVNDGDALGAVLRKNTRTCNKKYQNIHYR